MNRDSTRTAERMTHGENPQNGHGNSFLIGVLAGAAVGVGLGLLFAPRAGSELRRQVGGLSTSLRTDASRRYRQARERVDEAVAELTDSGQEVSGHVWNTIARSAQKVEAYATAGKTGPDRDLEGASRRRSSMTESGGSEDPAL
jgi:gas vesicle protein